MPLTVLARIGVAAARTPWARRLLLLAVALALTAGPTLLITLAYSALGGAAAAAAAGPASLPGVPGPALAAYAAAVSQVGAYAPGCSGLTWADLAAIAEVESTQAAGHQVAADGTVTPPIYGPGLDGTNGNGLIPNTAADAAFDGPGPYARAVGPFQILPGTWSALWARLARPGRGDPQNFADAALIAALALCGDGRALSDPAQLSAAIYSYNHSQVYVARVESWIATYTALGRTGGAAASGPLGGVVIAAAERELGVPYSWGAGTAAGPSYGTCDGGETGCRVKGFDCSGLSLFAYAQAGIALPRTAQQQWDDAPVKLPASAGLSDVQPGDLVFFAYDPAHPDAYDGNVHHVGLYLGGGQMVDAAHSGTSVREEAVWLDEFSGAGRY